MHKLFRASFLLIAFVFFTSNGVAQKSSRAIRLAKTITTNTLKKHVVTLSSDQMEGRETGKPGQKRAAVYIMQQLSQAGINPFGGSYFQKFPLMEINPMNVLVQVNGKELNFISDYQHYKNFGNMEAAAVPSVFIGYGEEKGGYKGVEANSKVVFMMGYRREGETLPLSMRIKMAHQQKAKAVFVIDEDGQSSSHYLTAKEQALVTDSFAYPIPVFHIGKSKADSLFSAGKGPSIKKWEQKKSKRQNNKSLTLSIDLKVDIVSYDLKSENVLAFIPGNELKNEVVVLMAHYDHLGMDGTEVYNGADDNATGCAALLEIIKAFHIAKEKGTGFKRSLLVMWVSGEEKGLLGSKYYCQNPYFSFTQTKAALNVDMIGRVDYYHENDSKPYVYVIGSDFINPELHAINEEVNSDYVKLNLDYRYNSKDDPNRFYYRSDHYNFAKKGVPSIFYFSGTHDDYHTIGDTYDKVDYNRLTKISQHIFYTAWTLVNTPRSL